MSTRGANQLQPAYTLRNSQPLATVWTVFFLKISHDQFVLILIKINSKLFPFFEYPVVGTCQGSAPISEERGAEEYLFGIQENQKFLIVFQKERLILLILYF